MAKIRKPTIRRVRRRNKTRSKRIRNRKTTRNRERVYRKSSRKKRTKPRKSRRKFIHVGGSSAFTPEPESEDEIEREVETMAKNPDAKQVMVGETSAGDRAGMWKAAGWGSPWIMLDRGQRNNITTDQANALFKKMYDEDPEVIKKHIREIVTRRVHYQKIHKEQKAEQERQKAEQERQKAEQERQKEKQNQKVIKKIQTKASEGTVDDFLNQINGFSLPKNIETVKKNYKEATDFSDFKIRMSNESPNPLTSSFPNILVLKNKLFLPDGNKPTFSDYSE